MIDGTDQLRFSEVKETLNDLYGKDSELSDKPLLFVLMHGADKWLEEFNMQITNRKQPN